MEHHDNNINSPPLFRLPESSTKALLITSLDHGYVAPSLTSPQYRLCATTTGRLFFVMIFSQPHGAQSLAKPLVSSLKSAEEKETLACKQTKTKKKPVVSSQIITRKRSLQLNNIPLDHFKQAQGFFFFFCFSAATAILLCGINF
jgi:hypothetical protein